MECVSGSEYQGMNGVGVRAGMAKTGGWVIVEEREEV